jgi:hypothetical protein
MNAASTVYSKRFEGAWLPDLTRFARNHAGRNPDCSVLRESVLRGRCPLTGFRYWLTPRTLAAAVFGGN